MEAVGGRAAADALLVGVESREDEVVVAQAAPTPVDVEEVGIRLELVAVAYELVSATRGQASVADGAVVRHFVIDHVSPILVSI